MILSKVQTTWILYFHFHFHSIHSRIHQIRIFHSVHRINPRINPFIKDYSILLSNSDAGWDVVSDWIVFSKRMNGIKDDLCAAGVLTYGWPTPFTTASEGVPRIQSAEKEAIRPQGNEGNCVKMSLRKCYCDENTLRHFLLHFSRLFTLLLECHSGCLRIRVRLEWLLAVAYASTRLLFILLAELWSFCRWLKIKITWKYTL